MRTGTVPQTSVRLALVRSETLLVPSQLVLRRSFAKKAKEAKGGSAATEKAQKETPVVDEKMVKEALLAGRGKMKEALDRFEKKLQAIRPGGVDAALIENLMVEIAPGKKVPLSSLGMVSAPTPLKLNVALNEREHSAAVEKAISGSGLNLQAKRLEDSGVVEVPVPKTTKEQREARVKLASEEAERVKVAIRGARQDVQKKLKSFGLPEDENKKQEKQLQTMADAAIDKVVENLEKKKKELLGGNKD